MPPTPNATATETIVTVRLLYTLRIGLMSAQPYADRMITPSVVSTKTIPQVNISGRIRIVQIGTADDTPTPTRWAIKAISVAVSQPRPNKTPAGTIGHGFRVR